MSNTPEEEAPPKKSKLKIILLILLLLLLAAGGAASYWWFQMRTPENVASTEATEEVVEESSSEGKEADKEGEKTEDSSDGKTSTVKPQTQVNLVNIPTVTVNLVDTNPVRYLKVGMDVEVNTKDAVKALNAQIARVRDAIIIILSGKTYDELATTAGKLSIKNDIITRLNQILGAPRVVQIYFTEFVVQ